MYSFNVVLGLLDELSSSVKHESEAGGLQRGGCRLGPQTIHLFMFVYGKNKDTPL